MLGEDVFVTVFFCFKCGVVVWVCGGLKKPLFFGSDFLFFWWVGVICC